MQDRDLLREYVLNHSERAFAELVSRHIDLVFAAARRMVGDTHTAKDVTQSVFIHLAKKAATVRDGDALPGWLYRVTCATANSLMRSEHRRRQRESTAMNLAELESNPPAAWNAVSPLLDEAMLRLSASEQDALVMRYFEGKSLREVGVALELSDDAAQKRISRALDKMRVYFVRNGVTVTAALLITLMAANSVSAAPLGLAGGITAAAFSQAAGAGGVGVVGSLAKAFAMRKAALGLVAAGVACGLAISVFWSGHAVDPSLGNTPSASSISLNPSAQASDGQRTLSLEAPVIISASDAVGTSHFTLSSMRTDGQDTVVLDGDGTITPVENGYFLQYDFKWQIFAGQPVAFSGQQIASKDDFEMQSSVVLKPNTPFTLLRAGSKTITLTTDGKTVTITITKML